METVCHFANTNNNTNNNNINNNTYTNGNNSNNNNNNTQYNNKDNKNQKKPGDTGNQNAIGNGTGAKESSYTAAAANANIINNIPTNNDKSLTKVQRKKPTAFFNAQTPRLDRQVCMDNT